MSSLCYRFSVRRIFSIAISFSLILAGLTLTSAEEVVVRQVHVLKLDDVIIGPVVDEYLTEGIAQAEEDGAEALIVVLDTPGGLLNSTRTIVKKILNANVPVVVYVGPSGARAGSAGVFITLSSHVAAMAPSTNIGAAHPVSVGGDKKEEGDGLSELLRRLAREKGDDAKKEEGAPPKKAESEKKPMEEKVLHDTVAWVTALATERGRNVDWAVRAVTESASITEREAVKQNVVDIIAGDTESLLAQLDGRKVLLPSGERTLKTAGAQVINRPMNKRQEFLSVLINPNIAYILMMLGFYGLLFEITHPGSWIPGIAGSICLILAFYAFHTIPTNYAGLALIALAFVLFIAEAFVPSFGFLTLGGAISLLLGSVFLIESPFEFMRVSINVIIPVVLATAAISIFLLSLAVRAYRQRSKTGSEALIGAVATAQTDLAPRGKVFLEGEYWDADADAPIAQGDKVKVIGRDGMKLKVRKMKSEES